MNVSLAHQHIRIAELTIEHFALENDELQATIRDLYQQNAQLRETLHACLDALRAKTTEARELRELIDHWQKAACRERPPVFTVKSEPAPTPLEDPSSERKTRGPESSWTH
jgi:hypothetical protein